MTGTEEGSGLSPISRVPASPPALIQSAHLTLSEHLIHAGSKEQPLAKWENDSHKPSGLVPAASWILHTGAHSHKC